MLRRLGVVLALFLVAAACSGDEEPTTLAPIAEGRTVPQAATVPPSAQAPPSTQPGEPTAASDDETSGPVAAALAEHKRLLDAEGSLSTPVARQQGEQLVEIRDCVWSGGFEMVFEYFDYQVVPSGEEYVATRIGERESAVACASASLVETVVPVVDEYLVLFNDLFANPVLNAPELDESPLLSDSRAEFMRPKIDRLATDGVVFYHGTDRVEGLVGMARDEGGIGEFLTIAWCVPMTDEYGAFRDGAKIEGDKPEDARGDELLTAVELEPAETELGWRIIGHSEYAWIACSASPAIQFGVVHRDLEFQFLA